MCIAEQPFSEVDQAINLCGRRRKEDAALKLILENSDSFAHVVQRGIVSSHIILE